MSTSEVKGGNVISIDSHLITYEDHQSVVTECRR